MDPEIVEMVRFLDPEIVEKVVKSYIACSGRFPTNLVGLAYNSKSCGQQISIVELYTLYSVRRLTKIF